MTDHIQDAAQAHTTLVLFETACMILESSDVRGDEAQETALKAIRILRKEQQRLLRKYDASRRLALQEIKHGQ